MPPRGAQCLRRSAEDFERELEDTAETGGEDPESHFNLGIAFREMGLLDEAIGEFQKVCRVDPHRLGSVPRPAGLHLAGHLLCGEGRGGGGHQLVSACVGDCTQRGVAHRRHLRTGQRLRGRRPQARGAERFMEVYGTNIDYRDVATRIRELRSSRAGVGVPPRARPVLFPPFPRPHGSARGRLQRRIKRPNTEAGYRGRILRPFPVTATAPDLSGPFRIHDGSRTAEPDSAPDRARPRRRRPPAAHPPLWAQRLLLVVEVAVAVWAGLLVMVLPWTRLWTQNPLLAHWPARASGAGQQLCARRDQRHRSGGCLDGLLRRPALPRPALRRPPVKSSGKGQP